MAGKRRRGSPRPKEDAETVNISLRISKRIYEEIRADADASGRSITAEAERRLPHREPGDNEVERLIGSAIAAVEKRAGGSWKDDQHVAEQCRFAADAVLNLLFGEPRRGVLGFEDTPPPASLSQR